MNVQFVRRATMACVGLFVIAMALLMISTTRARAGGSGLLDACINPGNGMMRLVSATTACHANETRVEWNITGPQGPQGPPGPQGPKGDPGSSSGGPPFTWVCTPANWNIGGNGPTAEIDVFNASNTTANIAAHFLAADGTNVGGGAIPGTSSPVLFYPGETGSTTVTLAAQHTATYNYVSGSGDPATNNHLVRSVSVTSDQPIVVGYNVPFGTYNTQPCGLVPK